MVPRNRPPGGHGPPDLPFVSGGHQISIHTDEAVDLFDIDTQHYLGHEDEDYLAKSVYSGAGVYWWMVDDITDLEPQPWP